jgi:hypothetical protein
MSLAGGLITLAYAIYRQDPVFIAGQSVGTFVYLRNLMLINRSAQSASSPHNGLIPSEEKGSGVAQKDSRPLPVADPAAFRGNG